MNRLSPIELEIAKKWCIQIAHKPHIKISVVVHPILVRLAKQMEEDKCSPSKHTVDYINEITKPKRVF